MNTKHLIFVMKLPLVLSVFVRMHSWVFPKLHPQDSAQCTADCLDPDFHFRINRKYIAKLSSINKINTYFNSRLKLELLPSPNDEVIVSRERVGNFKGWLDK